jgi:hypothetical protein
VDMLDLTHESSGRLDCLVRRGATLHITPPLDIGTKPWSSCGISRG